MAMSDLGARLVGLPDMSGYFCNCPAGRAAGIQNKEKAESETFVADVI